MKLFDILDNVATSQPTPAQVAASELLQVAGNIRREIKYGMETLSDRAHKIGMANIIAELPAEVRPMIPGLLMLMKTVWEAASDNAPFPDFPDQPTAAEDI